jgi:hypothetical protein
MGRAFVPQEILAHRGKKAPDCCPPNPVGLNFEDEWPKESMDANRAHLISNWYRARQENGILWRRSQSRPVQD